MSLFKRKYLNELFETQDFRLATQKGQRSTCHHLHMVVLTPIRYSYNSRLHNEPSARPKQQTYKRIRDTVFVIMHWGGGARQNLDSDTHPIKFEENPAMGV